MQSNAYTSLVLDTATVDETSGVRDMSAYDQIVTYVTGTGTISAGNLAIEEAATPGYTGTWSNITTVDLTGVDSNACLAVHFDQGAYRFVRWRLSDAVTGGGSVSVTVGAH